MSDIYAQHRTAFAAVSASVILKDGKHVATVAFKYPRNGTGRLYAYVHLLGQPMVRGFATGGGYDKHTAACAVAAKLMKPEGPNWERTDYAEAFIHALRRDAGASWVRALQDAGFAVITAV